MVLPVTATLCCLNFGAESISTGVPEPSDLVSGYTGLERSLDTTANLRISLEDLQPMELEQ